MGQSLNDFWGSNRSRRRPAAVDPAPFAGALEPEMRAQPPTPKSAGNGAGSVEMVGAATLAQVMDEMDLLSEGDGSRFQPLATGFTPLDNVLNGGLRAGELMIVGGPYGVGKTIFALQVARNVVMRHTESRAMYVCYEHDRGHLLSRLLCLESAECGYRDEALTLRTLGQMVEQGQGGGLISQLRGMPPYAPLLRAMESYADRLVLVKASGSHSTLDQIGRWAEEVVGSGHPSLLVVDYLQKIPMAGDRVREEDETTTFLTQGLKEIALQTGLAILAIAAADRAGLKSRRMYLSDLRGSSALQYEADVGLIFNNKYAIVSREHMVHNLNQADAMRNRVVMSVEKNRAGRNAVDMEFVQDPAHFRMIAEGDYVRDRLIDERLVLE
jgi:replicative DNA helicase